ncbi:MAG TPA: hypothetical protein VM223_19070 [Planctomycetota bacterium]|nr:hypothetical protein [Planctomycetota bacterium]
MLRGWLISLVLTAAAISAWGGEAAPAEPAAPRDEKASATSKDQPSATPPKDQQPAAPAKDQPVAVPAKDQPPAPPAKAKPPVEPAAVPEAPIEPKKPVPKVIFEGKVIEGPDITFAVSAPEIFLALANDNLVLDNGRVRLVLRMAPGRPAAQPGYRQEFYARDADGRWRMIARPAERGEEIATASSAGGLPEELAYPEVEVVRNDDVGVALALRARDARQSITTTIALDSAWQFFYISVDAEFTGRSLVEQVLSNFAFDGGRIGSISMPEAVRLAEPKGAGKPPDFIWAPGIRPAREDVIGERAFGSPLAIMQKGSCVLSIVPDVALLRKDRPMKTALSLYVPPPGSHPATPWISYGLCNYAIHSTHAYVHTASMAQDVTNARLRYAFYLYLDAQVKPGGGARDMADFVCKTIEQPDALARVRFQRRTLPDWCRSTYPSVARRLQEPADIWFCQNRQQLRAAYGLARYAQLAADDRLLNAARSAFELILAAPSEKQAFPSLFRQRKDSASTWVLCGDDCSARLPETRYSTAHGSSTGQWLLRWRERFARGNDDILNRCRDYGNLLLKVQLPSGCIPAWLDGERAAPVKDGLYDAGSECAESAAFLASLYAATKDERYLAGAAAVLDYLEREVLPGGRWFDHSVMAVPDDVYGGQFSQSTMSMVAAARACAIVAESAGRQQYLNLGARIIDHLALFQNAWDCEWTPTPFGAFAARNSGDDMLPQLQAEAADVLGDYFRLTGEPRYLDRALAAVRSALAAIDEDSATIGRGQREMAAADVLTTALDLRDRFGDAFVNPAASWGRGITGCLVRNLKCDDKSIAFDLLSPFTWERPATVRIAGCAGPRELVVNGASVGLLSAAQLDSGVRWMPRLPLMVEPVPITNALAGADLRIAAQVSGGMVQPDVHLFCRRQGGQDFTRVPMKLEFGTTWSALAPDNVAADPGTVEYFISATAGSETAVRPGNLSTFLSISLGGELKLTCGTDDAGYFATETEPMPATRPRRPGRFFNASHPLVYRIPLPPGTKSVAVEAEVLGECSLYAGSSLVEPAPPVAGGIRTFTITDADLWREGTLTIRFDAAEQAVLKRVTVAPKK